MIGDNDILLAEWKEIRETLRYFGNNRFAQLTVFLAAEGATIGGFLKEPPPAQPLVLQIAGILLSLLFLIMEYSSVLYWDKFAERGESIERSVKVLKMMTEYRPKEHGLLSGTNATYGLYVATLIFWCTTFIW